MKPWYKKKLVIIPVVLLFLVVLGAVGVQRAANHAAADKVAAAASQAAVTKAAADKVIADKAAADKVIADKAAAEAKAAQDVIDQAAADKAAAEAKVIADKAAAEKADGRPDNAVSLGESQTVDGIEITVTSFGRVHPLEPFDIFNYYGAKMSFKNITDGPKTIDPDLQVRLDNPYVSEDRALPIEIKEGEQVPWGAFHPDSTVSGYVVWAIPKHLKSLKGFSIIYSNLADEEASWWLGAK